MTRLINWHRGTDRVAIYQPQYNARGLLEAEGLRIGASLDDGRPSADLKNLRAVHSIAYNAKGQRTRLRHGNGTETRYAYDAQSFRLTQLRTTRPATALPFPGFHSNLSDERVVQQLHCTYDAAGNIAEILDEAWAPVFFRNQAVEPRSRYVYDALQRLIEATGRESAQLSAAPGPISEAFGVDAFPADHALRNYMQRYHYDAVGNFLRMQHVAEDGAWTRHYETAADSNRLLRTWTGSDEVGAVRYAYDTHGSMLNLANVPTLARIRWDWRDMIEGMDLGGGGHAWYAYDSGKQRTRKRIEQLGGTVEERLYLGGMELYRRYAPSGNLVEQIETHHLFVDDQRVLLVDDVIDTNNAQLGTGVLMRYQHGNHLDSAALELDETAQIVGCEEFHPYGTTAYQLVGHGVRATAKRYRYTGMERDEETGLSYHTARYYLPWLGRWLSVDPKLLHRVLHEEADERNSTETENAEWYEWASEEFFNGYLYVRDAPTSFMDQLGLDKTSVAVRLARRAAGRLIGEAGQGGARIAQRQITRRALARLEQGLSTETMEHILEHVTGAAGRSVTTLFAEGMTQARIAALIRETLERGATPVLSVMEETGRLGWVIEREFSEAIGQGGERILRVVVDRQGNVVTAFATSGFLPRFSIAGMTVSAALAATLFFASESIAAADSSVRAHYESLVRTEYETSWAEEAFYFLDPTMLLEPAHTGMEIDLGLAIQQYSETVARVEHERQSTLSQEERLIIREAIDEQHTQALLQAMEVHAH